MISSGNWIRAFHISERFSSWPQNSAATPDTGGPAMPANALDTWREQAPFGGGPWLAKRLAQEGLSEKEFLALADLSEKALWHLFGNSRVAERWAAIYSAPTPETPASRLPVGAFTRLTAPVAEEAAARLRSLAAALQQRWPAAPFDPAEVDRLLWPAVSERLDWMVSRAVVLELHLAKLRGELAGSTPAERFEFFLARLSEPARALEFFAEYSVLARCLLETLDLWVAASAEMLERLARDWEEILAGELSPAEHPGRLSEVAGGAGDLHGGGRAVQILRFESGFRIVYKPRSIAIHLRFSQFLDWLNIRGGEDLQAGRALAREGYGWLEFVAARPCRSDEELQRFYRRQGSFLAIFQILNATDFHRENLIARGEHPIFIDLECLLSPDYGQFDARNYDSLAHFEMQDSLMRIMLLPFFQEKDQAFYDPSGLGGEGGQAAVHDAPVWSRTATDEMRLDRRRTVVDAAQNRPTLGGSPVDVLQYRDALHQGFEAAYRLLFSHRDELSSDGSVLSVLAQSEVRIIFRASQFYALILQESYHPDLLRDALDRDRHFDRLWFGIDQSALPEVSLRILPAERRDLWRGDIPLFAAAGDSRDIRCGPAGPGGEALPDFLLRSGLEMARARLRGLSEEDLERQLWFIHASLSALAIELQPAKLESRPFRPRIRENAGGRDRLLAGAEAAAQRIGKLALTDGDQAAWVGLAQTNSRGWWLRPLDTDLYSGLPGVALFLAQSGAILGRPEDTKLARLCLANLDRQIARRERVTTVGGFDGWGGLIYAWLSVARLWNEASWTEKALRALPKTEAALENDEDLDLLRGSVGGIPPLLALHRETGAGAALELARKMGDRLIAKAQEYRESLYWKTSSFPVHPLTGFSHGNSGFAWALAQLHAATGDGRYLETARRALVFEGYFYSETRKNWMDLRVIKNSEVGKADYRKDASFNIRWCHGAPGIGLSRLRMAAHFDREEMLRDAENAALTTVREGFGYSHSLCHGDLGNIELLTELDRQFPSDERKAQIDTILDQTFAEFDQRGFLCGVPCFVETPGLMDGLAGIGYGLLRLAEPERVPSVLLLELPGHR